ncbi:MAG: protein translocase subunit SecD [bacterium]|nr:protein translocase subunit SecD [bacterium]
MRKKSLLFILAVFAATILAIFYISPTETGIGNGKWRLGLDLVGGSHLVYEVDMKDVIDSDRATVMAGLRDVIERRVNLFGVSEPQVLTARSGESYRIIIELAGIKDIAAAIQQIGETPFLVFSELGKSQTPIDLQTADGQTIQATATDSEETFIPTELTGRYVKSAQVNRSSQTGRVEILLNFNEEGAKLFEEITGRNVGKQLAVLLDGNIITAPVVNEKIVGGQAQITGTFTLSEAQQLVQRFNAGALPAPITLVSQQTIGATLGTDSLKEILFAGAIGMLLVMLFMLIYYRSLGFFASIALIIYTALVLVIFKLMFTLTLASIAGIVLSIGMAVDANILIFERTREEIKKGGQKHSAIIEGFHRAWPSIRDSNIATIITSLVLYNLTSSFIKGFALSLLIGVLVSMFTAITVTRVLLQVFIKEKKLVKQINLIT